ncbi:MAG: putative NAD/FAD-binding protein [Alphaproteobacteria bacterium]|jgi:predicted NAD/FAD-binding protein
MRIAIIGSGISGLGAAYYLGKKHETVLYEANDYLGGHTRTKTILYDTESMSVDTGFIVYNEKNYPHLTALFKTLGVVTNKSDMSFGTSVNDGEFEWSGRNLLGVFAQKSNFFKPWFYRMLADIKKFNDHGTQSVTNIQHNQLSLGSFLDGLNLSDAFMNYYLLPMAGAIWSCPPQKMREFPAKSFLTFFHNHGLLTITQQPQWYTVQGGAKNYVEKIVEATQNCEVRLNAPVKNVIRSGETVFLIDALGNREAFDKVVFACHGDTTFKMLENPDPQEIDALKSIQFQPNKVVLHRDISQMPKRKAAWASWVYQSDTSKTEHDIAVTYHMNRLQTTLPQNKPLFVTLNPIKDIPDHLIFDQVTLDHPIFTADTLASQNKIAVLQGHKNCYYAGAWTGYGFHEDGLRSAINVANLL